MELKEGIREWALRRVRSKVSENSSEDVVQEALIKMMEKDVPAQSQKSWLITALPFFIHHEFNRHVRQEARCLPTVNDEGIDQIELLPYEERGFDDVALAELLAHPLFLEHKKLLLEYAEDGEAVAENMGLKSSTLRMRVKKIRGIILDHLPGILN